MLPTIDASRRPRADAPIALPSQPRLPVLMYHAVSAVDGRLRRLGVPARLLEEQLSALVAAGHTLLGLTDALAAAGSGRAGVIAVTFDDGYVDFLRHAVPVLRELGARATVYVPTGYLGESAAWLGRRRTHVPHVMSPRDLRECVASGCVEVGSHSHSHEPLDVLPARRLRREIDGSLDILEDVLGLRVRSFCYPHGYHSSAVRRRVRDAGYDNACEVGRRVLPVTDRWSISRLAVEPRHTGEDLCRDVCNGGPIAVPTIKRALQPAWRELRATRRRVTVR